MSTNAKEAMHRRQLVAIAAHRDELKKPADQQDKTKLMTGREKIRVCRRCQICGRARAVYRKFGVLPDLLPQARERRVDPRRPQGVLVTAKGEDTTMMTDPIADMLTRIRNANEIERPFVEMPATKLKVALAKVLLEEGFILGYRTGKYVEATTENGSTKEFSEVEHARRAARRPAGVPEVRPGRRASDPPHRAVLEARPPRVPGLQGRASASSTASASPSSRTSKGVMSDREAKKNKVGGEILCTVW